MGVSIALEPKYQSAQSTVDALLAQVCGGTGLCVFQACSQRLRAVPHSDICVPYIVFVEHQLSSYGFVSSLLSRTAVCCGAYTQLCR